MQEELENILSRKHNNLIVQKKIKYQVRSCHTTTKQSKKRVINRTYTKIPSKVIEGLEIHNLTFLT